MDIIFLRRTAVFAARGPMSKRVLETLRVASALIRRDALSADDPSSIDCGSYSVIALNGSAGSVRSVRRMEKRVASQCRLPGIPLLDLN